MGYSFPYIPLSATFNQYLTTIRTYNIAVSPILNSIFISITRKRQTPATILTFNMNHTLYPIYTQFHNIFFFKKPILCIQDKKMIEKQGFDALKKGKKRTRFILFLLLFQIWKSSSFVNTNSHIIWFITRCSTLWCPLAEKVDSLDFSAFKLYIFTIQRPSFMCKGHKRYRRIRNKYLVI